MPPDSSAIENAIITKLGSDATLLGYMPNGVYYDEAPADSTKFVIVSLVEEADEATYGRRAFEDALYLVKAVGLWKSGSPTPPVQQAAARIDQLLEDGPLTVAGFQLMTMHRESRVRQTEVDDVDRSIRWQHRGGRYRVQMSVS